MKEHSIKIRYVFNSKNLAEILRFSEFLETKTLFLNKPSEEPIILKPGDITLSN